MKAVGSDHTLNAPFVTTEIEQKRFRIGVPKMEETLKGFCIRLLKFGVEYWADNNDEDESIPFRRRMFPSSLDGVEDRRAVPNWILRLANDIVGWDDYPWGSAYFVGRVSEAERSPRHLNCQNHYEVPSEFFQEQRSGLDQMMKQGQNIFKKINKFMEDMSVVTGANKEPIIVDQHYGISDLSGFQSIQGGLSSFQTLTNHSFFNMSTPINWQTPWPLQPGSSNWQSRMPMYTPTLNWQPSIPSHPGDVGLRDPNKLERPRVEQRPSVYMQSPYTPLPPTTELPKKRVYMPINVGGNHWVTGAVNLSILFFYVFDSMKSERTRLLLEHQIKAWTPVINGILQMRGYFYGSERQPHNFILSYNQGWGFSVPQQSNFQDCEVITCWLIAKLCVGHVPIAPRESERYWENIRHEMGELFYKWKNVEDLIRGKSFSKLDDDDVVSLCCIYILQLVLLGVEDRRAVPNWILRGANVKRWLPLYATKPTNEVDKKSYSIFGFTWAFKRFYGHMLRDFLHGRVPAERLIPDEIEAGSGWWVSSRAYFVGRVSEAERSPRHLNCQNHYEVPSEFFQEQRSGLDQMMKQGQNIFKKINKFMEDMSVVTGANKEPIIVDQHYGISDLSGFQSIQGGLSSFQTLTNHSFFNMSTPINWQTPWPLQPGSSNWQSRMPMYTPTLNWQPSIPSHPGDVGLRDPNKLERPRVEQRPSVYMQSPYTPLPPTTELPKKRERMTL
uniref:Transposase, MuDR, MULE transposase domain protein n=1 Tax=Tanacetum cinerariifolium TaxID=118510 RepID=A0A6L2KQU8_TANCI|nr:transposase, MuDR, MULE transposase domain protein [Tanacetum cinerariifolium]